MADQNYRRPDETGDGRQEYGGGSTYHGGRAAGWGETPGGNPNGMDGQPPQYGMNENGQYRYSYEDYDRISYGPGAGTADSGKKGGNGVKVFAVIMTVLFIIVVVMLVGLIAANRTETTSAGSIPTVENSSASADETSREELQVPSLSITSHAEEDTYISSDGKLTTPQIYEKVRPSVVGILNYGAENPLTASSSGSGIILTSDGYILTNAHVIEEAANLIVVLDNNEEYAAQVIGTDTTTDLAVLKIEAENLTAAELGDSSQLQVGEKVVAIGNPAGLNLAGSTTQGCVSGLDRTITVTLDSGETISMEVIQTDAAINPGNSGGPLINEYGQVIGINSSRLSSSTYNGIGFAIPINNALPVVEDLIQYGYVTGRVKLGITYYTISEVVGAMSGYTPGLLVYSVDTTMDIYQKGIRAGDIITEIDGTPVTTKDAVKQALEGKSPGDSILLTCYRTTAAGGSTFSVEVILGEDTGNSDTSSYSTETGGSVGVPTALPHSGT